MSRTALQDCPACQAATQRQVVRVIQLVYGDQVRPDRAESREGLSQGELGRGPGQLKLTLGEVLADHHPGHMRPRRLLGDPIAAASDHHHELDLPVHRTGRQYHGVVRSGQARRELGEDRWSGRLGKTGLGHVISVVQPNGEDLPRVGYWRAEATALVWVDRIRVGRRDPVAELLPALVDPLGIG
jgi:hypothetical protein